MKHSILLNFICITYLLITGCTAEAKQKRPRYLFKIATLAPDRSIWIRSYNEMSKEIMAATNGEVGFKSYPSGIQGDEKTVIRKIRIGQLQGGGFTQVGMTMICKDSLVLQLPHVFTSYEEFKYVFDKMRPIFEDQCRENGYEILGWPHLGFIYLFSKDRVVDLPTLKSSKPWLIEDDILSKAMFDVVGVTGVSAQIGDVLTALRSGLIHTVYAPPIGMITLQWYTGVSTRLDAKGIFSYGAFALNKRNWDKLPEGYQKTIRKICDGRFEEINNKVRAENRDALGILDKKKIITISPTEQGLRDFAITSEKVADRLAGDVFAKESLRLMQSYLKEFRDRNSKEESPAKEPEQKKG